MLAPYRFILLATAYLIPQYLTTVQDFRRLQIDPVLLLIALVLFAVRHFTPAEAPTFGALLQTERLLGGEIGNTFMQNYVRMAEQTQSYLVGLLVQEGISRVQQWLKMAGVALSLHGATASDVPSQFLAVLAQTIRAQANVLSIIDGFAACVIASIIGLCLIAMLRQP